MKDFLAQAAKLLKKNKQYRRQMVVFLCLAVVVTFGTVTALKLYGQAMTHQVEVLDCQYKVHEHTEECYDRDENGNLGTEPVCGYALYAIHTHNDACYDAKGNLVCALEEHEKHEHTEECYLTEKILVCELEETEVTVPPEEDAEASEETPEAPEETPETPEETPEETEAPAGEEPPAEPEAPSGEEAPAAPPEPAVPEGPICGKEPHTHGEGCYEDTIVCGFAEEHAHGEGCATQTLACTVAEHAHGEGCTDEEGNMTCTLEEHAHQEGCYTQEMTCGKEEHTHAEGCHAQNLVCALEEHEHIESCYAQAPAAPAQPQGSGEAPTAEGSGSLEECDETGEGHIHTEECYEEVTTLVCGELELHTHDDSCYSEECFDEEGKLIEGSRVSCGLLQLEEHIHVHTEGEDSCFKTVELTPEEVAALENGATLHIHEDGCYDEEGNLICGHDANHVHMPQCYDDAGKLICGYGTAVHVHEDKCYDEEKNLICGYETAEHPHDESCYDAEGNLQCGYETAAHVHEDSCYDEEGNVICGYEAASHVHEDSCYDAEGNLICGYETEVHVHEDSCYDAEGNLICGYETAKHVHEESCYDADGNVICGYEAAAHVHEDRCYDEEGNLVCGYEAASHPHTEDCYDEEGNLICGYETATHVHNESCYDEEGNVICGYAAEIHEHDEDCYDAEGNLICGYNKNGSALDALYCNELIHQHDEDCNDEAGNLICGKADFAAHTHTDECYNVEGKKICPLPEREAHVHSEECYPEGAAEGEEPSCGKEEIALHTHTDECYDAEGVPTCGETEVLEHVHSEDCKVSGQSVTKTFQNESFIITAVYNRDANIPEEAELLAEQITEESNGEHYAKRQAEYQEALGDDMATMRALLKIGFYVNGQEVEPESPVTITIQFLNEDGLAEGKPITVIHFVEDGTELLEGSKVEDGSTTFEMESFSEIAVGYGVENVRVPVDTELKYETDEFEVTFRIEGEVNVPVGDMEPEEEPGAEGENAAPDSPAESEAEESGTGDDAADEEAEAGTDDAESAGLPEGSESGEAEDSGDAEADVMTSENGVSVIIENSDLEKELEFRVDPLDENAEEYAKAAAAVYADGTEGADELDDQLFLQVLSYKMLYDGKKLDLSDCTVTAEVKPSEALVEYAETAVDPMTLDLDGEEQIADGVEVKPEVVITAVELGEDAAEGEIADAMVVGYEAMATPMLLSLRNADGIMLISGTSQANPIFTVQYYARINTIAEQPKQEPYFGLNVIDTSNDGSGNGGKLPQNTPKGDVNNKSVYEEFVRYGSKRYRLKTPTNAGVKKIYLDANGNVQNTESLLRIYEDREHDYITAPGLTYFNRLAENGNYEIKEIWIGKADTKESTEEKDWDIWKIGEGEGEVSLEKVHFTNKKATAEKEGFILISDGTVIKLVCEPTKRDVTNGASFYDYDISDGKIYKSDSTNSGLIPRGDKRYNDNANTPWYLWTDKQGINSNSNNLAFGNNNTRTTLGNNKVFNNFYLNRINAEMSPTFIYLGFDGCTFSLADSLKQDGTIQYASGVNAPDLFNESGNPNGKETYKGTGNSLTFERVGDTYTLKSAMVSGQSISGLEKFNQPASSSGSDVYATNNFWPMDNVASAGTDGHDPMFGVADTKEKLYGFSTDGKEGFPSSDDGQIHNSYFGMHYTVDFELTEDYIGPLEYLFYGDDDMWVFLSPIDEVGEKGKITGPGKLICDIGGVHSSVGEYVDLWDWIKKGDTGSYRLSFFYTERGASGSTCWMQFTLPSVSFSTPEQNTGELLIEKNVIGGETESEEFGFNITFTDANGNKLQDDYAYKKYSKNIKDAYGNDTVIAKDVLIWDDAKFTLKAGEYIVISYLPDGTNYTITEVGPVEVEQDANGLNGIAHDENGNPIWIVKPNNPYKPTIDGGSSSSPGVVTGTIFKQERVGITYNNHYKFALPETGGTGTILYTMAGGMVLLFGAGFLYKKKFRERRG